jgi:serpin B
MRLTFLVLLGLHPMSLAAQNNSTGRLTVILRDQAGQALQYGRVQLESVMRSSPVGPDGSLSLDFPVGTHRVRAVALGYLAADVSVTVTAGRSDTVSMTLREWGRPDPVEVARADSMRQANGNTDSLAEGLIQADTAGQFNFEKFGIDLLSAGISTTSADSNRVLSPLSAGQSLGIVLLAARDTSARAIAGGLQLEGLAPDELANRSRRFMDQVPQRRDLKLKVANGMWVDTSLTLNIGFQQQSEGGFGATVRVHPLMAPSIVGELNRWADSNTLGLIRRIRDSAFDRKTKVVILNAVYLKSTWLVPFPITATKPAPFTTATGELIERLAMERTAPFAYRQGIGYQAVRVPYAAGLSAMYIVLPDSGVMATTVLERMRGEGWPLPHPQRDQREVHLRLPRLHLEQKTMLLPVLKELGMGIITDSMRADFQGLAVPRDYQLPLCPPREEPQPIPCVRYFVSAASQDVYFDVDEVGTEAAAVTTFALSEQIITASPPVIQFLVDRPFLLAIRDERTGVMLFLGYIADPRN